MTEEDKPDLPITDKLIAISRTEKLTEQQYEKIRSKCYVMRLQGKNYTEIGEELDLCRKMVAKMVRELTDIITAEDMERIEQLRAEQHDRYMQLLQWNWDKAKETTEGSKVMLRIMRQLEELHGLNKPKKIEITENEPEEKARRRERLISKLDEQKRLRQADDTDFGEVVDAEILEGD